MRQGYLIEAGQIKEQVNQYGGEAVYVNCSHCGKQYIANQGKCIEKHLERKHGIDTLAIFNKYYMGQ